MQQRVQALATRFAEVNKAIDLLAEHCTAVQWQTSCATEGWSIGVTVHHVANGYDQEGWVAALIDAILGGQALPEHPSALYPERDYNQWHAEHFANCSQEETLALLRRNGAAVLRLIEGLQDEDLERTAPDSDNDMVSVQEAIEQIIIDHAQEHLKSLQATLENG
ncbi:MAG TPA: DinB family protein [Ktedonobacterales bacterium]|nr:DinB family protein [Ktedonobacterales bacterium]